jgi:hypothetical protein
MLRTTIAIAVLCVAVFAPAHAQRETCPAIGFTCGPSGQAVPVGRVAPSSGYARPANINPKTGRPYDTEAPTYRVPKRKAR